MAAVLVTAAILSANQTDSRNAAVVGHDLWSIDSDGRTFEIWESEYVRPKLVGRLVVTFTYPGQARVEWSGTL